MLWLIWIGVNAVSVSTSWDLFSATLSVLKSLPHEMDESISSVGESYANTISRCGMPRRFHHLDILQAMEDLVCSM